MKNKKKYKIVQLSKTASSACLVLALASCEVLNDTAASTGIGAGIGALAGSQLDKDNSGRGALIGGALGGLIGYSISKNYQASEQQKRTALAAGARAKSKTKSRYVAVQVPKKEGRGKDLMVYDTQESTLASDKAYVPPSDAKYSAGQEVNVGGKRAVLASAFQGV